MIHKRGQAGANPAGQGSLQIRLHTHRHPLRPAFQFLAQHVLVSKDLEVRRSNRNYGYAHNQGKDQPCSEKVHGSAPF
jgi:hypothetical protein